ncbi:MAG: MarC family protein [Dehalococcoidia bacterium]
MSTGEGLNLFISLVALANPLGNLPIFLHLTAGETAAGRRRVALVSGATAFVTLTAVYWFGPDALDAFGISLAAFFLGGGLVVTLYGLVMVRAPETLIPGPGDKTAAAEPRSPAIVPLAIPLFAGPAAFARVMYERFPHSRIEAEAEVTLVILAAAALITVVLLCSDLVVRWVGSAGISALSRILGMLLMAIGFSMITEALKQIWPALAG